MKKTAARPGLTLLLLANLFFSPLISKAESLCLVREPTIQISQFSFNNSEKDYVELTVQDDGNNGKGTILDGYTITSIDSTIKKLSGISVHTGTQLHFDDIGNLTSTTDQIVVKKDDRTLDAVCWANTKPTTQEISDFMKLETEGSWSKDIGSCIKSDVPKNTSLKRKSTQDTNSASDWEIAQTQTPNQPAAPSVPSSASIPPAEIKIATNEIIINEFMPDPEGSDDSNEWIELKNISDHEIAMTNWQLDDEEGGSKPYELKNIIIRAESFIVLKNSETNITLNNTADSVRLISPDGKEQAKAAYAKTSTGKSWAYSQEKTWKESSKPTPGEENVFESPEAKVENSKDEITPSSSPDPLVEVSEIFPNPKGADQGKEWIEIRNRIATPIILDGWKIKNGSGRSFTFPSGSIIPASGYLIITDEISKLSLKNSNDEVQIIDNDKQIQDLVEFEEAPENASFAKISLKNTTIQEKKSEISFENAFRWFIPRANAGEEVPQTEWQWTEAITKGKPNPTLMQIQGTVTREPDATNSFAVQTEKGEISIAYSETKTGADLLKSILKKNKKIHLKVYEMPTKELRLESFEENSEKNEMFESGSENIINENSIAAGFGLMFSGMLIYLIYRFKKSTTRDGDPAVLEPDDTPAGTFQKVQW